MSDNGLPPLDGKGDTQKSVPATTPTLADILMLDERDEVVSKLEALLDTTEEHIEIEAGDAVLDVSRVALLAAFIGEAQKRGKIIRLIPDDASDAWPWNMFDWEGGDA